MSIINKIVYDEIPIDNRPPLVPVRGTLNSASCEDLHVYGSAQVTVDFEGAEVTHDFWICDTIEHGIIGVDLLKQQKATLDVGRRKLFLGKKCIQLRASTGRPLYTKVICAQAVHVPPNRECIIMARVSRGRNQEHSSRMHFQPASCLHTVTGVLACHAVVPGDTTRVPVRVYNPGREPVTISRDMTLGVLSRVEEVTPLPGGVDNDDGTLDITTYQQVEVRSIRPPPLSPEHQSRARRFQLQMVRRNDTQAKSTDDQDDRCAGAATGLPKDTGDCADTGEGDDTGDRKDTGDCADTCEGVDTGDRVGTSDMLDTSASTNASRSDDTAGDTVNIEEVPEHLRHLYRRSIRDVTAHQAREIADMLQEYADVFSTTAGDLGQTKLVKHDIDTGDAKPVSERVRRHAYEATQEMEAEVQRLKDIGAIRESHSRWASNVVLVRKRGGGFRMCVDFRKLNLLTINDEPYPLPPINNSLETLKRARYFSTLDILLGHQQIELTETAKATTAFIVPRTIPNHWEFNRMPFGLHGTPRTVQRLIDRVIEGLPVNIAMAYVDDIIVFSQTCEEHIERLRLVFSQLRDADLKLRTSTCHLFQQQIVFMGHLVTEEGVSTDPDRVAAVLAWKPCRTARQVKAFIGMAKYYEELIEDFARIAEPLYVAERQRQRFEWTDECQKAFETLKLKLTSAPVMAHPVDDGLYILDTDASGHAIGAVLSQRQREANGDEVERVIAYGSRRMHAREMNYCIRRKEMLAMVDFVKYFRSYLYGKKVLLRTDHASLQYIRTMKEPTEQMYRWIGTLENVLQQYDIEVRKGTHHDNADGLSRMGCEGKTCICHGVYDQEIRGLPETNLVMRLEKDTTPAPDRRIRHMLPRDLIARDMIEVEDYGKMISANDNGFKVTFEELPVSTEGDTVDTSATQLDPNACDNCDGEDFELNVPHPAHEGLMPTLDCPDDNEVTPDQFRHLYRIKEIQFNEPRACKDEVIEGIDPDVVKQLEQQTWTIPDLTSPADAGPACATTGDQNLEPVKPEVCHMTDADDHQSTVPTKDNENEDDTEEPTSVSSAKVVNEVKFNDGLSSEEEEVTSPAGACATTPTVVKLCKGRVEETRRSLFDTAEASGAHGDVDEEQ